MSSSDSQVYRYTIPLETVDGVDRPAYNLNTNGEVLYSRVGNNTYTLVQTEPTPHYHKDSVNVQVEEVPLSNYVDDVDKYVEEDTVEDSTDSEVEEDSITDEDDSESIDSDVGDTEGE